MQWVAPSEPDLNGSTLEKRLREMADQFRANSGLAAQQYPSPIRSRIFLRFAEDEDEKRISQHRGAALRQRRDDGRRPTP